MRSLCIDTSVAATIALVKDGVTLGQATDPDSRHQAEGLGLLLDRVLVGAGITAGAASAKIDRIVVGVGPGPFTALRAGIAFASALGRGLEVPVLGIPSLDALGWQATREHADTDVLVLTDAKRREVYSAVYRKNGGGGIFEQAGAQVGSLAAALERASSTPTTVFYSGVRPAHLEDGLASVGAADVVLDPTALSHVADERTKDYPQVQFPLDPLYLRRPDVQGGTA